MENKCDIWLRQFYGVMPFEDYTLLDRAARTLEENSGGTRVKNGFPWEPLRGIQPSDMYFQGVWNWDSAFHMMGVVKWDPGFARDQMRLFMKIQQPDGMFPDVMFKKDGEVFSGGSKPPVFP